MKKYDTGNGILSVDKGIITSYTGDDKSLIGEKFDRKMAKACCWVLVKQPKIYFANGSKNGSTFI